MLLRPPQLAPLAAALALACLLPHSAAFAQVGPGDVGAATTIGNELDARGLQRQGGAVDSGVAAEAAAASADPAAGGAPPAEGQKAAAGGDKWNDEHSIGRLRASSVSWFKLSLVTLMLWCWVRAGAWINVDSQLFDLGYGLWNPAITFPMIVALPVALFLNVWAGLAAMALGWIVPVAAYAKRHNANVEPHEKVFTAEWMRYQLALGLRAIGVQVAAEKAADYTKGAPVDIEARGGPDDRTNQANLLTARQSPGYVLVKDLIAEMTQRRSSKVVFDYTQEAVGVRRLVDGVWQSGDARDRESGDVMLAVIKQLANLNAKERRAKQEGEFGAKFEGYKYQVLVATQGAQGGERATLQLRGGEQKDYKTFEQIGLREKLREQWTRIMLSDSGVVVYASLPEGGLTTLTDVGLLETDRLIRDFVAIQDAQDPQRDIENIEVATYDSKKGETPAKLVPGLARKYPNVYVCRDFVDATSAKMLLDEALNEERLVVTTTRATEACDALLRVIQAGAPHKEFAKAVRAVLYTRLVRLLCEGCKVGYDPTPDLLKKLGIPAGKVTRLYRTPKPEEIDKPCKYCGGIGFKGRTGLFELLEVDDQVREVLLKQPKIDLLRKAARLAGMRTLQEEGILLVAKGSTSIPELSRVLKGE